MNIFLASLVYSQLKLVDAISKRKAQISGAKLILLCGRVGEEAIPRRGRDCDSTAGALHGHFTKLFYLFSF